MFSPSPLTIVVHFSFHHFPKPKRMINVVKVTDMVAKAVREEVNIRFRSESASV
jgi:hypothetical protein